MKKWNKSWLVSGKKEKKVKSKHKAQLYDASVTFTMELNVGLMRSIEEKQENNRE